jgi:electron transfer flavoprotein beta subunit
LKILVTVKRIPDPEESLKFANGALDLSSAKRVPNAFDEYAVESALRLAEHVGTTNKLAEVIVLSVCPQAQRQHVTQFLAMGADRAVIVDAEESAVDSISISKLVAAVAKREGVDLVIAGKLSQDNEGNQIGQRTAALLDWPQACFAAGLEWNRGDSTLTVAREVDDGVEHKKVPLPAVVSVDLRVVLPHGVKNGATAADHAYQEGARLASLRGITMAKKKPVAVLTPAELGVALSTTESVTGVAKPADRKAGQKVDSVATLLDKLISEAKAI